MAFSIDYFRLSSENCLRPGETAGSVEWTSPKQQGKGNFLVWAAVALFFGGICAVILYPELHVVMLTHTLKSDGTTSVGTIIDKKEDSSNRYFIRYRFETPNQVFENNVWIDARYWYRLEHGYPVQIRYLPDKPSENLPWNCVLGTFGWAAISFTSMIFLASLALLIGLIVKLLRGEFNAKEFLVKCERVTPGP